MTVRLPGWRCHASILSMAMTARPVWAAGDPASLPIDLSPMGMFVKADSVVQTVMVGLAIASIMAWIVLFAKKFEIHRAIRRLQHISRNFANRCGLDDLAEGSYIRERIGDALLDAARDEIARSASMSAPDGVRDRIRMRMDRIEAAAAREISFGVNILATIGSTAPFIGLFGTVWGIMNSFIGISKSQTTNLAVVAPGIAEALLATAIGLVAAIPAVIFYNHLARAIGGYRALLGDVVVQVTVLATRDLDRHAAGRSPTL